MPSFFIAPNPMRRRRVASFLVPVALLVGLASHLGCSLDERTLVVEDGVSGASYSPGGSNAGGRAGAHTGAGGALLPSAGTDSGGQAGEAGEAGQAGDSG